MTNTTTTDKIKIEKTTDGEWLVYVPPTGPHSFDVDGWSHLGPYGDSFWGSWDAAVEFVNMVIRTELGRALDFFLGPAVV